MALMDFRKLYREFKRKSAHSTTVTRTMVGQEFSSERLLIEQHSGIDDTNHYKRDAILSVVGDWNGEEPVLIEIEVANYTRTGARRSMHHSLTLPREVADALVKALQGRPASEVMAEMPGASRIDEKGNRVTTP